MKLIFERSTENKSGFELCPAQVPHHTLNAELRGTPAQLPQVAEIDLVRHYTALSKQAYGVDDGFYPLGSCTMKYNPRLNEQMAKLDGFNNIHPLCDDKDAQGSIAVMKQLSGALCELTGMDNLTLQPAAGAHGEFTGLLLIKKYHDVRKDYARTTIIVPDSAHGTNPASANMCGFKIVSIPSNQYGGVDIDALTKAVGPDTAGLMLTNPNTLGLFDPNILQITEIVHNAGGLCYYDGANFNAIMGKCRPGDMGFDCVHLNIHKTFSTPHGGGGPGSGPVGCKKFLAPYLPTPTFGDKATKSVGKVRSFYGNFPVYLKGYCYVLTLGGQGLTSASELAVLNANYLKVKLGQFFKVAIDKTCMHEFVLDLTDYKTQYNVSALDVAKTMLDYKLHPPTMYFPLIVHEALMFEPTETESKTTLDEVCDTMEKIAQMAKNGYDLHASPQHAFIKRVDEVRAARQPVLRYQEQ